MNIFKWLVSRGGKVSLSAAQAVGLSAVVGVAGIAAWQYLDAPSDNTAFNLGGPNTRGEVVYVAGGAGGTYGEGGEPQSAFLAKPSKAIEMTEKMTLAQKRAEEYSDYSYPEADPSSPAAYRMGGSEGLGMGANWANEEKLKNDPMSAAQNSLAGMTDIINQVQTKAARAQAGAASAGGSSGGAAGGQSEGDAPAGALASANRDWGSSAATRGIRGGGGGNAFNSSFVIQDSGKSGGKTSSAGDIQNAANVMKQFQAQVASAQQEGVRLRSRANFGDSNGIGDNWDTAIGNARRSKDGKDLEFIRKRSADAAANRNRSANEGARAFLASNKISGGMQVVGENVTTGQGQSSADFSAGHTANLQAIGDWSATADVQQEQRAADRNSLTKWLWTAASVALAAMIAIPLIKNINLAGVPVGMIIALAMAGLATAFCVVGFVKAQQFSNAWGNSGMSTALKIITPILTGGVWASFIWASAFKELYTSVGDKLGIIPKK